RHRRPGHARRASGGIPRRHPRALDGRRTEGSVRSLCYPGGARRGEARGPGKHPRPENLVAVRFLLRAPMRAADAEGKWAWQGIASILLFLGLWQIAAGLAGSRLVPGPATLLQSLLD